MKTENKSPRTKHQSILKSSLFLCWSQHAAGLVSCRPRGQSCRGMELEASWPPHPVPPLCPPGMFLEDNCCLSYLSWVWCSPHTSSFPYFNFPPETHPPYLEVLPEMRWGCSPAVMQGLAPLAGGTEIPRCCGAGAPGDGEPLGCDLAKGWGRCPGCPYSTAGLPPDAKRAGNHHVHAQIVVCSKNCHSYKVQKNHIFLLFLLVQ